MPKSDQQFHFWHKIVPLRIAAASKITQLFLFWHILYQCQLEGAFLKSYGPYPQELGCHKQKIIKNHNFLVLLGSQKDPMNLLSEYVIFPIKINICANILFICMFYWEVRELLKIDWLPLTVAFSSSSVA